MLAPLTSWRRQLTSDGVALSPERERGVSLRVRDRIGPIRPFRAVVDEILAASAGWFAAPEVGPLERLTTREGESAGLVVVSGRVAGLAAERTIGMIAGDDGYTLIDALARDPDEFAELRAQARELARSYSLGLGALRWRRFGYAPPAGWHGLRRGLSAEWYPIEFPAHSALITVLPARPATHLLDPAALQVDRLLREHTLAEPGFTAESAASEVIASAGGMLGMLYRVEGAVDGRGRLACATAVLGDGRFAYVLRLECAAERWDEERERFAAVVTSVEPVPGADAAAGGNPVDAVAHWVC